MNILKSIRNLNTFELKLWLGSLAALTMSFFAGGTGDILTLSATLTGATALIFVSKGDALGQLLTVIFSLLYAIISFRFRYYGEMITYLGMTAPIAAISLISWLKHPYSEHEVRIRHLNVQTLLVLSFSTIFTTIVFYFILRYFSTPNLLFSTISIATSFSASALMMLRSSFYAVAYALNDIVLIILWILATVENISYLPMILCFVIFFINDLYGFKNWHTMSARQANDKCRI